MKILQQQKKKANKIGPILGCQVLLARYFRPQTIANSPDLYLFQEFQSLGVHSGRSFLAYNQVVGVLFEIIGSRFSVIVHFTSLRVIRLTRGQVFFFFFSEAPSSLDYQPNLKSFCLCQWVDDLGLFSSTTIDDFRTAASSAQFH